MARRTSIINLIEQAIDGSVTQLLDSYVAANEIELGDDEGQVTKKQALDELEKAAEALYAMFTRKDYEGNSSAVPVVPLEEAAKTDDYSILFPRVINTVLRDPIEPVYFMSRNLVEEITLDASSPLTIEFPQIAPLQAGEIGQGGEYPSQNLALGRHMVQIKIQKWGLQSNLTEEVIQASQYPIMAIQLRAMRRAMDRLFESQCFEGMQAVAPTLFDNENSPYTSGVDGTFTANYTFSYWDLVTMCGAVIKNRKIPTHVLGHPLGWGVFSMDPFLRATFFHGGQIGQSVWNTAPQYDQQYNMPFSMTYVPYYALDLGINQQLAVGPGSGLAATLLTDLYVVDQSEALYAATRGPAEVSDFADWFTDSQAVKIRRYWGISAKDGGRGFARAKKIRIDRNHEPLFSVRNTT